ncbi:hypothetical protein ACTFIR_006575 [Dictyostelium discoideum]
MEKHDIKYFENKKQCQFQEWYEKFKSVTFSSIIIPLPKIFIDYLQSDQFTTPHEGFPEFKVDEHDDLFDDNNWSTSKNHISTLDPKYYQGYSSDEEDESSDDDDSNDNDGDGDKDKKPKRIVNETEFKELSNQIIKSIEKLGGNIFPKLNWSSPKDASWMNVYNSLKCTNTTDIYLLLKSSDFINHDLMQFSINQDDKDDSLTPYVLVLRKWQNLQPSMEFRCFVKDNQLLGISQRDTSTYFKFLKDKKQKIQDAIVKFYNESICEKFSNNSFTFDCYVTKDEQVWLIDFNPIHPSTEALLFVWDELIPELIEQDQDEKENEETKQAKEELPIEPLTKLEFRIIDDESGIKPNLAMTSRLPLDLLQSSGGTGQGNINDLLLNFKNQNLN